MTDEAPDLRKLLSTNMDDVKEPPLLAAGTYDGIITKYQYGVTTGERKAPYVEFSVQLTGAGADVAEEDMEGVDLSKKLMRFSAYLDADSLWRTKELLQKIGIDTAGRQLDSLIPETINREVLVEVVQKPRKDEIGKFRNEVKSLGGR